jgi:hypothetical protein
VEHQLKPTLYQLRWAAACFDQLAERYNFRYAFGGSFIAVMKRLQAQDHGFDVFELEIVVEPRLLENNFAFFRKVVVDLPQFMVGPTETGHWLMICGEGKGVSIRCYGLGSCHYPNSFLPMRNPDGFLGQEAAVYRLSLGFPGPNNRSVSVLRSRLLLVQRLFALNDGVDCSHELQYLYDIRAFLRDSVATREMAFPSDIRLILLPIVKRTIRTADVLGVRTTFDDLFGWRRLGLNVGDHYASLPIIDPFEVNAPWIYGGA